MEETRERIVKISKIIQITIIICMIVFGTLILVGLIIAFFPYGEKNLLGFHTRLVDNLNLLPTDVIRFFMNDSDIRLQIMLAGITISLISAVILYLIYECKKVFKYTILSGTPFNSQTSKDLIKLSVKSLLLIFFSTITGIVVFLLFRLFAYIFEYGAYLQEKANETNRIQEEMIMSFAEVLENKSDQTGKHVRRVAEYSGLIALEMNCDKDWVNILRLASTLHDIGKLMIDDTILEKPSRLTDEEFQEIKKHTLYGGKLLENVDGEVMHMARNIALEHHERPDGGGYPKGKTLDELSLESQIVAVADVYDALTSRRCYKQAWEPQDAYDEIIKGRGTQFSEAVVDAFIKVYPQIMSIREQFNEKAI